MPRTKRAEKLLNPNQPTEQLGLIFVHQIAQRMRAIWRPTPNDDYGLDGELELTRSGVVTGFILKVQVKSGISYMHKRNASSFEFPVSPADAQYWARVGFPVILIVYNPEAHAGYWIDVKRYMGDHPEFESTLTIRFSLRGNRLTAESLLDLSESAIPDEVDRTEFLVDQIKETLHTNMLPVIGAPSAVYEAEFSARRIAEAIDDGYQLAKPSNGKHLSFRDPMSLSNSLRVYLDPTTVREYRYPDYQLRSLTRNYAVGRWNEAMRTFLHARGLLQKDDDTFYFAPEEGNTARKITWESTRGRTPERQVAYPYVGKESQSIVFWVHHACRAAFCEIGGHFFLRLTPAYVFTRDGSQLVAGKEAGALSTSRKSKDRNYQVLNHLMFWLWFLADGKDEIKLTVDDSEVIVKAEYWAGDASFGIPADKKSLIEIIAAEHDVDWKELETAATVDAPEQE
jgi:hypothetical protein